ncbi:MAG: cyclase family protein [Promethearchaeota archaeon]
MGFIFAKLKPDEHLPNGKGLSTETVTLGTHSGTHMDAPWHYAPIQDKETLEKKAMIIDEFPLEWGIGPLIVLDCTNYEEGYVMTPEDIDRKLEDRCHRMTSEIKTFHFLV